MNSHRLKYLNIKPFQFDCDNTSLTIIVHSFCSPFFCFAYIYYLCIISLVTGVTISFILAGAACVLNALCYAELSSRFPAVVGGAYLYSYTAFNELVAFLVFAQLMVDYHIGAASIARSLASYLVSFLELFPFLKGHFPSWIGHGEEFFGGVVSINILAPIILILLTIILCYGVKESSAVNSFMTTMKVTFIKLRKFDVDHFFNLFYMTF